jgi:hypothetical protein
VPKLTGALAPLREVRRPVLQSSANPSGQAEARRVGWIRRCCREAGGRYLRGVRWRMLLAVVLAGIVLGWGWNAGSGLDGPCLGSTFARSAPEGSADSSEISWWPPGVRCVTVAPDGSEEQRTFPGLVTWGVAVFVGLTPFASRPRPHLHEA